MTADKKTQDRTCFVVSPIGEEDSPTRERANRVLKHIIRKALQPLGYKVERADEINLPGTINTQVVERVFNADLVVADLTEKNANVLYELAIRHAAKKPAIHLISLDEEIPFDINQIRVVKFNLTDPDSIEAAQERLREQVRAIEGGETVLTPVQIAQVLATLETGEARDKQILEVIQGLSVGISQIRADLTRLLSHIDKSVDDAIQRSKIVESLRSAVFGRTSTLASGLPHQAIDEKPPTLGGTDLGRFLEYLMNLQSHYAGTGGSATKQPKKK